MNKIKILHYIPGFHTGGIESVFLSWYKNINKEEVNFELLVRSFDSESPMLKEYLEMGGVLHTLQTPSLNPKTMLTFRKQVQTFFKEHHTYDFLHVHVADDPFVIPAAQKIGIKNIGIHAHTTGYNESYKSQDLKGMIRKSNIKRAKYYFACSQEAADWMFPIEIRKKKQVHIIHNGIDAKSYEFNEETRGQYRKQLNLKNQFTLIHVGRFSEVKNHPFMLEIFQKVKVKHPNSKMIFIGNGPLFETIEHKIEELRLKDDILLLGARGDVAKIVQAADVFLLPSQFEGLGIAAIEAQAACLPTFVSDRVPQDVAITDLVHFLSLEIPVEEWADQILEHIHDEKRKSTYEQIKEAHYDIQQTTQDLILEYKNMIDKE
ncbi:glycosyltransferase [Jeotgalibaca sp. MA1X17-3]|uniref:glycosyltransferase n=1 Tax=Jeotgalibaca sp. MA1X17-3 TaxID=2908211 RepID=UPI001F3A0D73|nr:glycosyltransferase [Jeotgalibaca sp. MA1X17-3]UJF15248.1 glycosyltransferase [Jeotgalibaca sp. MA1X17-3]